MEKKMVHKPHAKNKKNRPVAVFRHHGGKQVCTKLRIIIRESLAVMMRPFNSENKLDKSGGLLNESSI